MRISRVVRFGISCRDSIPWSAAMYKILNAKLIWIQKLNKLKNL
jgi:hypothetical protein